MFNLYDEACNNRICCCYVFVCCCVLCFVLLFFDFIVIGGMCTNKKKLKSNAIFKILINPAWITSKLEQNIILFQKSKLLYMLLITDSTIHISIHSMRILRLKIGLRNDQDFRIFLSYYYRTAPYYKNKNRKSRFGI